MTLEPVSISERAAKEVKEIMHHKGIPADYALRVGIKGAGCGAMGFVIGFDKAQDDDLTYVSNGISLLVSRKHAMYVVGVEVDFYDGADGRGFSFERPDEN